MGKQTHRIGLVQVDSGTPARTPERVALAAAIQAYAELKQALDENRMSQKRAEDAKFNAIRAVDAANKAIEEAKIADAESVATGTAGGAVKAARTALQDAEDNYESAKVAEKLLSDRSGDVSNSIEDMRLKRAVADVIRTSPEIASLLQRYQSARAEFHNIHGVLGVLFSAKVLPRELEVAVQNIDIREVVHRGLPDSPIAASVQAWIEKLKSDADAELAE